MEKRGISRLVLISSVALLIILAAFLYLYTSEEKVVLTPEEQEKAKSLDLTPKEFKEVSTKAEEFFRENEPSYEEGFLRYSDVDERSLEGFGKYNPEIKKIVQALEIKPGSKIVEVGYLHGMPAPYIVYIVEDGEVKVLIENLRSAPY